MSSWLIPHVFSSSRKRNNHLMPRLRMRNAKSHRKQLTEHFKFLSQAGDIGSHFTTTLPLPVETDTIKKSLKVHASPFFCMFSFFAKAIVYKYL